MRPQITNPQDDALPADGLEPGLYLLLLETADGSTYRIKAVKE